MDFVQNFEFHGLFELNSHPYDLIDIGLMRLKNSINNPKQFSHIIDPYKKSLHVTPLHLFTFFPPHLSIKKSVRIYFMRGRQANYVTFVRIVLIHRKCILCFAGLHKNKTVAAAASITRGMTQLKLYLSCVIITGHSTCRQHGISIIRYCCVSLGSHYEKKQ